MVVLPCQGHIGEWKAIGTGSRCGMESLKLRISCLGTGQVGMASFRRCLRCQGTPCAGQKYRPTPSLLAPLVAILHVVFCSRRIGAVMVINLSTRANPSFSTNCCHGPPQTHLPNTPPTMVYFSRSQSVSEGFVLGPFMGASAPPQRHGASQAGEADPRALTGLESGWRLRHAVVPVVGK